MSDFDIRFPITRRTLRRIPLVCIMGIVLAASLSSCSNAKVDDFKAEQGVARLVNMYYYEIQFPGGIRWYCEDIDSSGRVKNLFLELGEIKSSLKLNVGNAFFIDDRGTLVTTRHLADPKIKIEYMRRHPQVFMESVRQLCNEYINKVSVRIDSLEQQKLNNYYYDNDGYEHVEEGKLLRLEHEQEELVNREQYHRLTLRYVMDIGTDLSKVKINTMGDMGLIYHGEKTGNITKAVKKSPCTLVYTDKKHSPLALIRLNNESTPDSAHIFAVAGTMPPEVGFWNKYINKDEVKVRPAEEIKQLKTICFDPKKDEAAPVVDDDDIVRSIIVGDKRLEEKELSSFINGYYQK